MKRTLIFYKPAYVDLAMKLRDNYRAHNHGEADIVSEEEHDDVEYAEKMKYDEAVFIEDSDTVTIHDIESGYTKKLPVSAVFYNDPNCDSLRNGVNCGAEGTSAPRSAIWRSTSAIPSAGTKRSGRS